MKYYLPFFLAVGGNLLYHLSQKASPQGANPFAAQARLRLATLTPVISRQGVRPRERDPQTPARPRALPVPQKLWARAARLYSARR